MVHIYDDGKLPLDAAYNAKRLLHDSVTRTQNGYRSISDREILTGSCNIVLARIESAVACAFVAVTGSLLIVVALPLNACFLVPVSILNLASRIPGLSSFNPVQNFTKNTNQIMARILKVNIIAIPVIFTFVTASFCNTFLPILLKEQNVFFRAIHWMVESLGPLERVHAVFEEDNTITATGSKKIFSILEGEEEYLRSLSYKNYLQTEITSHLVIHRTYTCYV
jgi:hypothetical protein